MKRIGIIIACALFGHAALADIQLTMVDKETGAEQPDGKTIISVRGGKVHFAQKGDGMSASMLYDSATGSFAQIDHTDKSYMMVDEAAMDGAADQMSAMRKQIEARMANLTDEQRAAMANMPGLAGLGKKPEQSSFDFEWTGEKDEVAGYGCKVATITEATGDTSSACIASRSELGMSKGDFDTLAAMFTKMQSFAKRFSDGETMPDIKEIGGIPIATTGDDHESRLDSASNDKLDNRLFEIPAEYKQRSMPSFGQ